MEQRRRKQVIKSNSCPVKRQIERNTYQVEIIIRLHNNAHKLQMEIILPVENNNEDDPLKMAGLVLLKLAADLEEKGYAEIANTLRLRAFRQGLIMQDIKCAQECDFPVLTRHVWNRSTPNGTKAS
jgi:hypothetical protein